jgi:hypothetical protein
MQFNLIHNISLLSKQLELTFTLRIFSVVLFIILLAGMFSPFIESIALLKHHSKMHQKKDKVTKTITLSKATYEQEHLTSKDEIVLEGNFFDIHTIEYVKDSVIITGVFDHEESLLRDKLTKGLSHHAKHRNSISFFSFFFVENNVELKSFNEFEVILNHLSTYIYPISSAFLRLDEHPPCS